MRTYLLAAALAIAAGFVVRMEALTWSSWTEIRNEVPHGFTDDARKNAFEQLSYCLMYGGTALMVLTLAYRQRTASGRHFT